MSRLGKEVDRDEYLSVFRDRAHDPSWQKDALSQAHDIRKFEIELYWKRAAYFWTFIAAAFAGYFLLNRDNSDPNLTAQFIVTCLGLVFSVAWYFVNRGSSAWQRNWETHVDLLEDDIVGPLHKTIIDRSLYKFRNLAGPYGFSPSRINQVLSLFVSAVWLCLAIATALAWLGLTGSERVIFWTMPFLTVAGIFTLFFLGKPTRGRREVEIDVRPFPKITRFTRQ